MCILAVATNFHEDFDFLLIHNRDEFYSRDAAPPKILLEDGSVIICPVDDQSGGTWMGFNATSGRVVALTNVRAMSPPYSDRRSRGELVMRTLLSNSTKEQEEILGDSYYNYHLFQTVLNTTTTEPFTLTTSAPPSFKPQTIQYNIPSPSKKPFVATKSNDHGVGLTMAKYKKNDTTVRWPKAVWLRNEMERILTEEEITTGQAGAEQVLEHLEPIMSTTTMPPPFQQEAAAAVPSPWNPLSRKQERALSKAPFVLPFLLYDDDDDSLYGTVSQSVLLYSSKEQCLYYAYRETMSEELPSWTWQRVQVEASGK